MLFRDQIAVVQGRFRLANVDILHASKNLFVVQADCHSKYPGSCVVSTGPGDTVMVYVFPDNERSLHLADDTTTDTHIVLPRRCADWTVVAEGARYTVNIVAFRLTGKRREVWRDEQ